MSTTALVMQSNYLPAISNTDGDALDNYLAQIGNIPILSAEQEQELAEKLHTNQDLEAARQLVMAHLRFVVHIARGYVGYGLALADLIQEGNIGLMKAVKRFDPTVGVRLISFAVHWIRAEIHEFIIRNWRIVKIATTKAQRKLFFRLRSSKQRLGWLNQEEARLVAADLGVPTKAVLDMEARLSNQDVAFEVSDDSDEQEAYAPSQYIAAENADPALLLEHDDWQGQSLDQLEYALATIDQRSRDILQSRWLNDNSKATLHELADEYGVSAERIRQLEANAIKKLRQQLITKEK